MPASSRLNAGTGAGTVGLKMPLEMSIDNDLIEKACTTSGEKFLVNERGQTGKQTQINTLYNHREQKSILKHRRHELFCLLHLMITLASKPLTQKNNNLREETTDKQRLKKQHNNMNLLYG